VHDGPGHLAERRLVHESIAHLGCTLCISANPSAAFASGRADRRTFGYDRYTTSCWAVVLTRCDSSTSVQSETARGPLGDWGLPNHSNAGQTPPDAVQS